MNILSMYKWQYEIMKSHNFLDEKVMIDFKQVLPKNTHIYISIWAAMSLTKLLQIQLHL